MTNIRFQIGNCRTQIPQIVNLALQVYREEDVSSIVKYYALYDQSPESFIMAIDSTNEKVLGYIIAVPFSEKYFERTLSPDYNEECLTPREVRPYQKGANKIYLFSIVTKPDYENRIAILSGLSRTFKEQLKNMLSEGIYITEASALALSVSGIKICMGLKMNIIGTNIRGSVFHNPDFYKLYINSPSKEDSIKNIIRNKLLNSRGESEMPNIHKSKQADSGRESEYNSFWLSSLISDETIAKSSFSDWINGFESRYSVCDLVKMEAIWNKRREKLLS